jgi:hypothetical protein
LAKILVLLLTGKENIHAEMVAFNFAINAVKNAHSTLEFLFLGRGVQALNSRQKNSPQFLEQIEGLRRAGCTVKACKVSLESEGLDESSIFGNIDLVLGGVEVNSKIEEGFSVISF